MTWSTPPSKAVGDVLYAADINALSADVALLGNPPMSSWYLSNTVTVGTGGSSTIVKLDFGLVNQDVTYSAATGLFTVHTAGVYKPDGQVSFRFANTTGFRQGSWLQNGAQISVTQQPGVNTLQSIATRAPLVRCAVGDTLAMGAYQTSGVTMNLETAGRSTWAAVKMISL